MPGYLKLLLGALCAAAAVTYWQLRPVEPPGMPPDRQPSGQIAAAVLSKPGPWRDAPAPHAIVPRTISAAMSARLARRAEIWEKADDRFPDALAFVHSLLTAARAGDVEAQRAIAETLQSCDWWEHSNRDGKTWRQRLQDPPSRSPHWAEVKADVEKHLARCETLNQASANEVGSYGEWMDRAAAGGDGQALLARSYLTAGRTADDQVEDFHRAIATGDPAVLREIVATYAYQLDGFSWRQAGSDKSLGQMNLLKASLDLVDCSLAQDCSAPSGENCSTWWSAYDCGYASDIRNYYELRLSRQAFADVDEYAQTLVAAFLGGGFDWPEAKAYEEALRSRSKEGDPGKH